MARYGRPVLPEDAARSQRIVTFVTLAEDKKLKAMAAEYSISVSALCHRFIAQALDRHCGSETGSDISG